MKHFPLTALLTLSAGVAIASEPFAGYDRMAVDTKHRALPIAASIWYPTGISTYRMLVGDNHIFKGTEAYIGAAVKKGKHPLVVLSHGSGGNMDGISWLSSALARRGAFVLAVNHPGSTTGDSSPRRSMQMDERAKDLSAALDSLLEASALEKHIDKSRITSLGFSLGGATALNLIGARWDADRYNEYCKGIGKNQADCVFLSKGGVNFAQMPAGYSKTAPDPRFSSAIAVDPGFTYSADDESLKRITQPVLLINIGREDLWLAADVGPNGSKLSEKLPNATYSVVAPGDHFTFLAECKPEGAEILASENDDPVCDDPEGTDRAKIHSEIVDEVARFLHL